jgi:hypothetical protein
MITKRTVLWLVASAMSILGFTCAAERSASAKQTVETADLDAHTQGPSAAHGGDVRLAGPYWLELVVANGSLTVFVTDRSGHPIDTAGGAGTATAHTDGKGARVELRSAGGHRLAGKARLKVKRSTVVFVTVHLRGEKPHRAVFRPSESDATDSDR